MGGDRSHIIGRSSREAARRLTDAKFTVPLAPRATICGTSIVVNVCRKSPRERNAQEEIAHPIAKLKVSRAGLFLSGGRTGLLRLNLNQPLPHFESAASSVKNSQMESDPITKFCVERKAWPVVKAALSDTRVVLVSGPRHAGKTTHEYVEPLGSSPLEID